LPANAACQPTSMPRTHRHRGQARSYTGFAAADLSRQETGCAPGDIYSLTLPLPWLSAVQEGFSAGWVCSTPYPTRRLAPEDLLMLTFNKLFLALAFLGSSAAAQAADGNADVSRTDYGKNTERSDRINGLRRSLATSAQVGSWSQAFNQQPADNAYVANYGSFTARVNGVRLQASGLTAYTVPMPQSSTTKLSINNPDATARDPQQPLSLSLNESPHTYLPVHHIL
jgi:hypothetical protein